LLLLPYAGLNIVATSIVTGEDVPEKPSTAGLNRSYRLQLLPAGLLLGNQWFFIHPRLPQYDICPGKIRKRRRAMSQSEISGEIFSVEIEGSANPIRVYPSRLKLVCP
jgi:hypothetical protein